MNCEHCGNEMVESHPPVEDYVEHKFCINIFGWKLMLFREDIELACTSCMIDEQQAIEDENFDNAMIDRIRHEIENGNLKEF